MPNTLAHIGVQGPITRALIGRADVKWVYLGCLLPDIPWMVHRVARQILADVSVYDLRLYAVVQSSLFVCLILSAGLACLSRRTGRVFAILAMGSLLHLLLDSLQTKWANGAHFFAPFSWSLTNLGLFWPESLPTVLLTGLGPIFFLYAWLRIPVDASDLSWPRGRKLAAVGAALTAYVALPLALLSEPEAIDNHSIKTLRETEARPGRPVEFDRARFRHGPGQDTVITFAGEELVVRGAALDRSGTASIRGRFLDQKTVLSEDIHLHWPIARDAASYVGLMLIMLCWLKALRSPASCQRDPPSQADPEPR